MLRSELDILINATIFFGLGICLGYVCNVMERIEASMPVGCFRLSYQPSAMSKGLSASNPYLVAIEMLSLWL